MLLGTFHFLPGLVKAYNQLQMKEGNLSQKTNKFFKLGIDYNRTGLQYVMKTTYSANFVESSQNMVK